MNLELFCDTSYFVALLDPHDELHDQAVALEHEHRNANFCTTSAVLIETLNYFSRYQPEVRAAAAEFVTGIEQHQQVAIIHVSRDLFKTATDFYTSRIDKSYSGTDCISMVVMQERGIALALTSDAHFQQEKFVVLLNNDFLYE